MHAVAETVVTNLIRCALRPTLARLPIPGEQPAGSIPASALSRLDATAKVGRFVDPAVRGSVVDREHRGTCWGGAHRPPMRGRGAGFFVPAQVCGPSRSCNHYRPASLCLPLAPGLWAGPLSSRIKRGEGFCFVLQ